MEPNVNLKTDSNPNLRQSPADDLLAWKLERALQAEVSVSEATPVICLPPAPLFCYTRHYKEGVQLLKTSRVSWNIIQCRKEEQEPLGGRLKFKLRFKSYFQYMLRDIIQVT